MVYMEEVGRIRITRKQYNWFTRIVPALRLFLKQEKTTFPSGQHTQDPTNYDK